MIGTDLTEDEFDRYRSLIYRIAGIRIPPNKRILVTNRIRRRLRATGVDTFADYYTLLTASNSGEMPLFLDEITTNETYFFRDPHHYQWLGETFLPELIRLSRLGRRPRRLRVWSAACSTGEELHSIAIKVLEHKALLGGWKTTLLGTDISGSVLNVAQAGFYDNRALRIVSPLQRTRYFDHEAGAARWSIKPEVRALVSWRPHNLLDPLLGEEPFDCIFLKNVLIYFDSESKQVAVRRIVSVLAKGGFLVVGPTEGISHMLDGLVRKSIWLYQRPA
jgi:chemotaxis protein methyltransferase CheR